MRAIPSRRAVHAALASALLSAGTAALASCGGGATLRPTPQRDGLGLSCADAYRIGSSLERPSRLEVWNESGTDVRVALDECGSLRHLGWVRAGAKTTLALPSTLVQFPEGLRLHAYGLDPTGEIGTWGVDPGAQVPRLIIDPPSP